MGGWGLKGEADAEAHLALGISAWQWHDTRGRLMELTDTSARRLAELETKAKDAGKRAAADAPDGPSDMLTGGDR